MQTGGNSYYYTLDLIGSVLQLTDSAGNNAATYTYNPYGKTLTATGSQATTNHYRYASGYTDTTGLIKFGARYYSPTTTRFTQPDPSGQETNNYSYVGDNPMSKTDPTGLCGEWYSILPCPSPVPEQGDPWTIDRHCVEWGGGAAVGGGIGGAFIGPEGAVFGAGGAFIGGCLSSVLFDVFA